MFLLWFSKLLLNFVDLYCSKELLHCKLITNWRLVSGLVKDVDFTIFVQAIQAIQNTFILNALIFCLQI